MRTSLLKRKHFLFLLPGVVAILAFQNCAQGFKSSGPMGSASTNSSSSSRGGAGDSGTPTPGPSPTPGPTPQPSPAPGASDALDAQTASCTLPEYTGWKCLKQNLVSQEGLSYSIEFRWNRPALPVAGTVLWVNGNHGNAPFRSASADARAIQDRLSTNDTVRSVEIIFSDALVPGNDFSGGYWKYPRGYYSSSSAYFAALEYAVNSGMKKGSFLNHIGGSNGTMVAAYALSNFNAGKYLSRVIFNAGPFLPDMKSACNPDHFASFSRSPTQFNFIKQLINYWSSGDGARDACTLTTDRSSLLKTEQVVLPQTAVHVFMGAKEDPDGFGPWILQSNLQWFTRVVAPEKSRVVIPTMGHDYNWPGLYDLARKSAPSSLTSVQPVLVTSLTLDGAAVANVPLNATVYGAVRGMPQTGVFGCASQVDDSHCDNPNNWTAMPNSDWSYSNGVWRAAYKPSALGVTVGMKYKSFWYDSATGKRTATEILTVVP